MVLQQTFEGRQTQDPREYNAFKEIADRLEKLEKVLRVNPDNNIGFGFDPVSSVLAADFFDETKRLGIGLPALTLTERDALSNPPARTLIYNKSFNCLSFFDGTVWIDIGATRHAYGTVGSSTLGETELFGIDLPMSFIVKPGESFYWEFIGLTTINGNNKQFKVYFDGTTIWDASTNPANDAVIGRGIIVNLDVTNQFSLVDGLMGTNIFPKATALAKTLKNSLRLSVKATAAGANNDCIGKSLIVRKN